MKNMSIKNSMAAILLVMFAFLMLLGGAGIFGLNSVNNSLKTVYDDRLVCVGQQDFVIRQIERNHYLIARALQDDPSRGDVYLNQIKSNFEEGKKVWGAYLATFIIPEEQKLIDAYARAYSEYESKVYVPALEAIAKKDLALGKAILNNESETIFSNVRHKMNDLIKLQLQVGEAEYLNSQLNFGRFNWFTGVIMLLSVSVVVAAAWWIQRCVTAPLVEAVEIADVIARGDLTQTIQSNSGNETGNLLNALSQMNAGLIDIVSQLREGADTIAAATADIARGNLDLSNRTENQSANLEETASAMEELTSTVQHNAENAQHAHKLVMQASQYATEGGNVVDNVVATMGTIKESSRKIVDIISVIDGIAFQTNILALNAAVEAARAGEQGRGFAVVATEVRNLAQRSASAAKEIKELITDSVSTVDAGDKLVSEAGETMNKTVQSIKQVAEIMAEIASASAEQRAGIEQISISINETDQVTQQNTALVEEAAAATEALRNQANTLLNLVTRFKVEPQAKIHRGYNDSASSKTGLDYHPRLAN